MDSPSPPARRLRRAQFLPLARFVPPAQILAQVQFLAQVLALLVVAAGCTTVAVPDLPPSWTADDAKRALTHEDCVDLASRWAPTAAAWQARLAGSQAALEQERLLPNPILGVSWEDLGLFGPQPSAIQHTFTLAYALEQLITRKARVAIATHDLSAEVADLLAERQRLALAVHRAYDGVLAARARAELRRELESVASRQRDDMVRFASAGGAAEFVSERAAAELAAATADRVQAESDARTAELELAYALGFAEPVSLRLSDPLSREPSGVPAALTGRLDVAMHTRPELIAARERLEAALERVHIQVSRAHLFPTFRYGPRWTGGESSSVAEVELPLAVFDTGAVAERAENAALLQAAAELRTATQEVIAQVGLASHRLSAAQDYLEHHAHDLADRRRRIREGTERQFAAEEASYDDVVLSHRDEVEARLALLDAEEAAAAAAIDLRAALGEFATPGPPGDPAE